MLEIVLFLLTTAQWTSLDKSQITTQVWSTNQCENNTNTNVTETETKTELGTKMEKQTQSIYMGKQ